MLTIEELFEKLSDYLKGKKVLELGCGTGRYTKYLSELAETVTAIEMNIDSYTNVIENLEPCKNVTIYNQNATKLEFADNTFDVVVGFNFFHELDPSIQELVLNEVMRVAKPNPTIIFTDTQEGAAGNYLFKVFDPNEQHEIRIRNANKVMKDFMDKNSLTEVLTGEAKSELQFATREAFLNDMLSRWNDIKVPKDEVEKEKMLNDITEILNRYNMLETLIYFEPIIYRVFKSN